MRTAEKAGRIFFTLIGILGVMLLFLPHIGISVDSIMSGSMEPVLRTGGIVFTDTKERRPEIGDIVTYQVGENRVTHRVIRKERKGYVTKGDANNKEDPTVVTADQIIGKVIFVLPCLGYVSICQTENDIWNTGSYDHTGNVLPAYAMERRAQQKKRRKNL